MLNLLGTLLKAATTYGPSVWAAIHAVIAAFEEYTTLMDKAKATGDVTPADVDLATQAMNSAVDEFFASVAAHAAVTVPGAGDTAAAAAAASSSTTT